MKAHWEEHGDADRLHMERFQPVIGAEPGGGEGGPIRFLKSDIEAESDGSAPILVGWRGGRRHASLRLPDGHLPHLHRAALLGQIRDLRTGEVGGTEGEMIRTCVNAPEGPVEIEL